MREEERRGGEGRGEEGRGGEGGRERGRERESHFSSPIVVPTRNPAQLSHSSAPLIWI